MSGDIHGSRSELHELLLLVRPSTFEAIIGYTPRVSTVPVCDFRKLCSPMGYIACCSFCGNQKRFGTLSHLSEALFHPTAGPVYKSPSNSSG